MKNVTKFNILSPAHEVYEAFVDPAKIGNFWFSSSSERWATGKTITLKYDLYNAEGEIQVVETKENERIVFEWGPPGAERVVSISLTAVDPSSTLIEIVEDGFKGDGEQLIHEIVDNKEGWVFMLTCLKAYLEFGVTELRGGIVK